MDKINKNSAMLILNSKLSPITLNVKNTHWSNIINYGTETGWWLNIPFHKFANDLYFILNDEHGKCFICVQLPGNTVKSPEKTFRNKQGAADIFISSSGRDKMVDIQSGSSRFNFDKFQLLGIKLS